MENIDANHVNPLGGNKNICAHIRKALNHGRTEKILKDDQAITEQLFKEFTDLEEIENLIFDKVKKETTESFIVRLYVATRRPKKFAEKFQAFFSGLFTEVGNAHLAVQINDKLVHWFDCGLVLIQPFEGSNCTALFYPHDEDDNEVLTIDNTQVNRENIAKVIQLYNCKKTYNVKNTNCQNFTQDIFKALNLKSQFSKMDGPVGFFLKLVINKGKEKKFSPCLVDKDLKIIKHEGKDLVWKTHEELDKWSTENDGENEETFKQYASLLKGFHRAFQLRERAELKSEKEHYKSENCPLGMPTLHTDRNLEAEEFYETTNTSFSTFLKISNYTHSGISSNNNN